MGAKAALPAVREVRWTPRLIRQLRGKRTQAELGRLLGAAKNTVWRWESGRVHPDASYSARLSALAERERFREKWQIVGSLSVVGDLDSAAAEIAKLFKASLERTAAGLDG